MKVRGSSAKMMYYEFDATFACGFCFFLCLYNPASEIAFDVIVLKLDHASATSFASSTKTLPLM